MFVQNDILCMRDWQFLFNVEILNSGGSEEKSGVEGEVRGNWRREILFYVPSKKKKERGKRKEPCHP